MNKKVKITVILGVIIAILMLIPITSNAALQANGKSTKVDRIDNWLLNIRRMEAIGGTLGLTDTINTTDLTSSAGTSNNLDIHMQLNTEYGAMAILSASAYGNQNKIKSGQTTTGNKSGVYIYLNCEWVAAGKPKTDYKLFQNANGKYKNVYSGAETDTKKGDATTETIGWHNSTSKWYWTDSINSTSMGMIRDACSSIFGFDNGEGEYSTGDNYASYIKSYYSRAVIVVGKDL